MGGLGSEGIEVLDTAQVVQVRIAQDFTLGVVAAIFRREQGVDGPGDVFGERANDGHVKVRVAIFGRQGKGLVAGR